ncbi:hypothetical protein P2G88_03495 [Aliiglaciecola sp. CAU 1673]|uniref:hypothetical protein n=1 Tax=Aliiglaciecola sp. CAU 1673 TaxID=3032595 RepID=UPI0023DCD754|nr:hypothetical protein [Aliiglaciecola sp. CAU 1673]MDF2177307.1 hypothetical protein [Aliiglaciecola sp. CAU 1673]
MPVTGKHQPSPHLAPTQVCISIDTEFSIAGHFQSPQSRFPVSHPLVYGPTPEGQQGLGFMLDCFNRFGIRATFFTETANLRYFGDEPMARVVNDLKQADQDIQLHVHPVWMSFDKEDGYGQFPRQDDCANQQADYLRQVFSYCIDGFKRLTGEAPKAIRTGNLRADLTTYQVLAELGIKLSSNIATGVYRPDDPALQLDSGRHLIEGVMELPVLTYADSSWFGKTHMKSLQITSCSWPEMRHLLWKARSLGIEQVIILTHPFEFFKSRDPQYKQLRRNRVNQERLLNLCRFVQSHDQDFVAADFGRHHEQWTATQKQEAPLSIPSYYALGRKLHNKLNDSLWQY